ncbi:hypothetical protein WSS_A34307 [Rhodococcus opacus M213]|uniref:DUF8175 domain-containing protein n=1 Tax=Rhodococcus opacus M213 TaxID=1129896 RepID=K8XBA4_RHOOP|nr:hypothetical protein [Rhodococcus opacus]EKT78091.1 hypothetical protein WSS_A34307 [Rhodococcus opacus M213]
MTKLMGRNNPLVTKEFATTPMSPWLRRGPVLLGGAGALVLLIVLVVILFRGTGSDELTPGPAPETSAAEPVNPQIPEHDPSKQRRPADPDWLTGAPAGLVWRQVDKIPLPFGAADGPSKIDEDAGTAAGYSHTPQGAVLAGYQIGNRIALGPDYARVVDAQTVFDPAAAADVKAHRGTPDPSALDGQVHSSAFKVLAYLPTQATVQYAMPNPMNGTYNSYQFTVVWAGGDWKLVAPNDTASAKALSSIDGFTPF